MTLVADAIHPAVLGWRYRTGRIVRQEYASAVTPVTLVEADGFEVAASSRNGRYAYAVMDDSLWAIAMGVPGRHLPSDDLVDWLEGRPIHALARAELDSLMARTPLSKALVPDAPRKRPGACRGLQLALPRNGIVVGNEGAEAGMAVQSWLDANVRICGGNVLVRTPGPHVAFVDGEPIVLHRPRDRSPWSLAMRADTAEAFWNWRVSRGEASESIPPFEDFGVWNRVAGLADPADGDSLQVCTAIAWADAMLSRHLDGDGMEAGDPFDPIGMKAARTGLAPLVGPAALGLVSGAEAPDAFLPCARALRALLAHEAALKEARLGHRREPWHVRSNPQGPDMAYTVALRLAFVEEVVLPRLSGVPSLDGDDMDALGGMAP